MVSIKAELTKRGVFVTDPKAAAIYQQGVMLGGVEALALIQSEVTAATPVGHTGILRKSWGMRMRMGVPFWGEVFNPMSYGEVVEKGSKPHDIYPRVKKALAFIPGTTPGTHTVAEKYVSSGTVVVKHVRHPGTKGKRFVAKTAQMLNKAGSPFLRLWDRVIEKIIGRLS